MKKYSLIWWYRTGATFRAQGSKKTTRYAKRFIDHIAYSLGYRFGTWIEDKGGDFKRINEARN